MERKFLFATHCKGVGRGNGLGKMEITLCLDEKKCLNYETLEEGTFATIGISGHVKRMWGQCLDEMWANRRFVAKEDKVKFYALYNLWRNNHLNDMIPGTKKQMDALMEGFVYNRNLDYGMKWDGHTYKHGKDYYTQECEYLDSIGLLTDNGYRFGTKWLCRPIDDDDIALIKELMEVK